MFSKRALVSFVSALAMWLVPQSAGAAGKLFMWKITSGQSTVYLVGSIHMVPKDFYPLPAEMEKAFDDSGTLVLEIDERKADPTTMMSAGVYQDGDELANHISGDTKTELDKYCAHADAMTNMALHKMRPWCAANTIGILEVQKRGFDKDYGIDKHFLKEAEDQKKGVEELESVDFQLHAFSDLSDDLQDKMLKSALTDVDHMDKDAKDMLSAWKAGDDELMESVATRDEKEQPGLKPIMEKLLYERNQTMAKKIEEYLKSGKKTFVVVGAAHLTGPRGLVALLKAKDYKIEQVRGS